MKSDTSDLTGPALDWAVAKCEGIPVTTSGIYRYLGRVNQELLGYQIYFGSVAFKPSTKWSQGGPIIEREQIALNLLFNQAPERLWMASATGGSHSPSVVQYGPTPLIAAMRCYVVSKLGDTADVPEELRS